LSTIHQIDFIPFHLLNYGNFDKTFSICATENLQCISTRLMENKEQGQALERKTHWRNIKVNYTAARENNST